LPNGGVCYAGIRRPSTPPKPLKSPTLCCVQAPSSSSCPGRSSAHRTRTCAACRS